MKLYKACNKRTAHGVQYTDYKAGMKLNKVRFKHTA